MSYYQISSGNGPAECELAVAKFLRYLLDNFKGIEIIELNQGDEAGTLKSAFIKSEEDLSEFIGATSGFARVLSGPLTSVKTGL